jgi:hypothetical protein
VHHRLVGAIVSVVALVATTWPVVLDPKKPGNDGFPLSTYPMFASKRKLTQTFTYAVAWTADHERRRIRPRHVANMEVMQANMAFANAKREKRLPALCASIAARVGADAALTDVARIEIVTGTHHALEFLLEDKRGAERVLETCEVPR